MPLDATALKMLRGALDTKYADAQGNVKPLRYFTATDCRSFAHKNQDPAVGELAELIEDGEVVTVGEALARQEALAVSDCARCAFENAVREVVYSGEFIEHHYGHKRGHLSQSERDLLGLCRAWLTDDAIDRCLEPDG